MLLYVGLEFLLSLGRKVLPFSFDRSMFKVRLGFFFFIESTVGILLAETKKLWFCGWCGLHTEQNYFFFIKYLKKAVVFPW